MEIGAAYIRVSDDRQDEYSPDSQLKLIHEYAKKHDYIIPEEYVFYDDGISAKNAERRADFNKMIAIAKDKSKPFSAIFVWKFSRFARNQEESIVYKSLLKKNGVDVISISEPIFDGPFGSLIERIIEWMDEYYLINLSAEVKRGMLEKASRGEAMCHPAFGYDLKGKQYVPNNDSAIIREIFELYAAGGGMRAIAQQLGNRGVRTTFGNFPDNRWIEYILNNPVYIGKIRWSKDGRAASARKYDDPNMLIINGKHEPIIDDTLWNKVQERLSESKLKYRKYRRCEPGSVDWMLKGLVRCSNCGATLVYQSTKSPSVQCHKYAKGQCNQSHCITIAKLNRAFILALSNSIRDLDFESAPATRKMTAEKIDYERLINIEMKKLERVQEAYQKGVDTLDEYKMNKEKLLKRIGELKQSLQNQEATAPKTDVVKFAARLKSILVDLQNDHLTESAKNTLLKSLVSDVTFDKKNNMLNISFLPQ